MANTFEVIGLALQGKNLNLICIRGFANLGLLAKYSSPDVMNQVENPLGTQRPLKAKHAKEVSDYALESLYADEITDPRSFPEIILNVRDERVVNLTQLDEEIYAGIDDYVYDRWGSTSVLVQVDPAKYEYPAQEYNPQISRIDGNHRLHMASKYLDAGYDLAQFPIVPYCMYLGLSRDQERKLFVDINGNAAPVTGSTRGTLEGQTNKGRDPWNFTIPELQNWVVYRLVSEGGVFEGMANLGGWLRGYQSDVFGSKPPITFLSVKSAVKEFFSTGRQFIQYIRDPEIVYATVSAYFEALSVVYPEAWANKREYILLDSIGLSGFGKLGGVLAVDWLENQQLAVEAHFHQILRPLAREMPLDKFRFGGHYGADGIRRVFQKALDLSRNS